MRDVRSGLSRHIDVQIPSNQFVIVATFAAGAVGSLAEWVRDGFDIPSMLGAGFTAGGAAFLSWTIARELDPDRNLTAYLATLIGLAVWFFEPPGLLISGAVLLAARIVAATTGGRLIPIDLAFLAGFALVAAARPGGIIAAAALGVAIVADCRLSDHRSPLQYGAGLAAVVGAAVIAVTWADTLTFDSLTAPAIAFAGAAVIAGTAIPVGPVTSTGDITGRPLSASRIRWARLGAVAILAGYIYLGGAAGVTVVGPAAAALLALASPYVVRANR